MKRIPGWLMVSLWAATLGLFVIAAVLTLREQDPDPWQVLGRFVAPAVLLAVAVLIEIVLPLLATADIQMWVFLGAVVVTGILFCAGLYSSVAATRDALLKAAFSVGGFAVGLQVGGQLDHQPKTPPSLPPPDGSAKKTSRSKKSG